MAGGRPSKYTKAIAEEICERIADGQSLRTVCDDEHMPNRSTVRAWNRTNEEFHTQYARAREEQADTFLDELMDITEIGDIAKARLKSDNFKWIMCKMLPKKYGDKKEVSHKGEINIKNFIEDLDDE